MTGKLRLPPLNALKAFHAVARHKSLRRAAEELLVSPQAVGQQIKLLEECLQITLFERKGRAIEPTESALVLADEPTGNLDSRSASEIGELLSQVSTEWGRSVLMVTHDPRIASYAQRLVLMRDGRVVDDVELDGSHDGPRQALERAGLL